MHLNSIWLATLANVNVIHLHTYCNCMEMHRRQLSITLAPKHGQYCFLLTSAGRSWEWCNGVWAGKTEFIIVQLLWKVTSYEIQRRWTPRMLQCCLVLRSVAVFVLLFLWGSSRQRLIFIPCSRGFLNLPKASEFWVRLDKTLSQAMT